MVREGCGQGQCGSDALIGALYVNGEGVALDYAKAKGWYEKAAAKDDNVKSVHIIDTMTGRGVDPNHPAGVSVEMEMVYPKDPEQPAKKAK